MCRAIGGRLHFAGEHTCYAFMGFMEGALNSGVRAAARIANGWITRMVQGVFLDHGLHGSHRSCCLFGPRITRITRITGLNGRLRIATA